jgi:hypothetical protein
MDTREGPERPTELVPMHLVVADPEAPALCKAGKHPFTRHNRTKRGHCRLCQREKERERYLRTRALKARKSCPRWNGTVVHLFQLKWVRIEVGHWIWQHSVNKPTKRPSLGWKGRYWNPARLIWETSGNPAIPTGHVLARNVDRCSQQLCVHPAHHHILKRGAHLPEGARKKGPQILRARWASTDLDSEIAKRIRRDDTKCWRWVGSFAGKAHKLRRAVFCFRGNSIGIRTYLWGRAGGKVPATHFLRHTDRNICSSPDECVNPKHLYLQDRREFGATVGGRSRGHGPKRPIIAGQEWPGTLWDPDVDMNCRHCRRGFDHHGVPELIATKLQVPLNRRHHVCLPTRVQTRGKSARKPRKAAATQARGEVE